MDLPTLIKFNKKQFYFCFFFIAEQSIIFEFRMATFKIKPITEQVIVPIQDIKLIPSGVLYLSTNFNKNILDTDNANELISELSVYKVPRYVDLGSNTDNVQYTMGSNEVGNNTETNPLEVPLPGIINSDNADETTVSLFLYKYSDVPLRSNAEKPRLFSHLSNMDYYPIDAINYGESFRTFTDQYEYATAKDGLNNTSTFNTSVNYYDTGDTSENTHKSMYVLGSLPYMYRALKFYGDNYKQKVDIIKRYYPIFDPNYNYDTSASKPINEIYIDNNGYLVDKAVNGKRVIVSAFQIFSAPTNIEVYLGVKEIEIPMQVHELTLSGNNDEQRILIAKFPRYLMDDSIEHYRAIKYMRLVNYTPSGDNKTKCYYNKQGLENDNDKNQLTNESEYGTKLAELNIQFSR